MTDLVKLGAVVSLVMGQAPAASDCNKEGRGTPFVKVGEFGSERPVIREWTTDPKKIARDSDVLICVVGATCGKINLGADCAIGRSVAAIRPNPRKIDQRYLWFFMQGKVLDMRSLSKGAAQTVITREMISELEIPLPSLAEQQRIVAILDEAFDGIAVAQSAETATVNNLDRLAGTLLGRLFERATLGGRRRLADICSFQGGAQPPKSNFVRQPLEGYVRLIQIRDFSSDKYAVYIPISRSNKLCRDTDIMIGRYGASVGQIHRGMAGAYNVALIRTSPDVSQIDPEYFFLYLKSDLFQRPLAAVANRSAQAGFSKDDIASFEVPVPSLEAQYDMVKALNGLAAEVATARAIHQRKLALLAELKQSLLARAFSGELTREPLAA